MTVHADLLPPTREGICPVWECGARRTRLFHLYATRCANGHDVAERDQFISATTKRAPLPFAARR